MDSKGASQVMKLPQVKTRHGAIESLQEYDRPVTEAALFGANPAGEISLTPVLALMVPGILADGPAN